MRYGMLEDSDTEIDIDEIIATLRGTAVSEEFLVEIGRIVVNFALLERELFSLIHGLLKTSEETSRILTSELPFRTLLDLSASLVKQIHGVDEAERYKEVLKIASGAEDERNLIVHSIWGINLGGNTIIRTKHTAKRRKGLHFNREEYTKGKLIAVGQKISRAIHSVEKFRQSLGYPWA
jgi:hypothetical protein